MSDTNASSGCDGGSAYACWDMSPWAVDDTLAYGYAAVSSAVSGDVCGRCYELHFTGTSHSSSSDEGSRGLCGKRMIVQVTNIGGDVDRQQFDILIPGGGVGQFNGCSTQWNASDSELGNDYGGILAKCVSTMGLPPPPLDEYKACVREACNTLFGSGNYTDLVEGCNWFIDWFHVANNPAFVYNEVTCPAELLNRGGLRRSGSDVANSCL